MPGMLHGVAGVYHDLRALLGVRDEEDLLAQPEVPAAVRVDSVGGEFLVQRFPERRVVGERRVGCL